MATTAKLFTLGKAQAVRIPARFRLEADEVEITERDGVLMLRPKPRTAADMFAAIRANHGQLAIDRPEQGVLEPVQPLSR
ncbi:MAG: AbrB/MazE/SpoVT family DNA-binding domain-containing protein [Xanthomonadaceae bacterium]|nr:AbrB/MazE/SpoVT family DNA-binding domain-containing protein [Xanthomonadaceae bacterium]MDP2184375.1 AbrB/MazE/SpoVT family DNA-binding domain-containing protein [Xanthomonadales bacterium]MDZ4116852.1 AbrB/MazE/SpoVT family DNA-binding domain-containing protein [Xanthomonadaceae bacterium]MDZ4378602.1 AbrB/MazE/SpoVT family DNA-binding domain-containing protein [Xanthomonadaceae bacterium]